jgi:short-subunit dehydrogenase
MNPKKNILITGASSSIGRTLIKNLTAKTPDERPGIKQQSLR